MIKDKTYLNYLRLFKTQIELSTNLNETVDLHAKVFNDMSQAIIENQIKQNIKPTDAKILTSIFKNDGLTNSIADLSLLININKMIEYQTSDKTVQQRPNPTNYAIIERLSLLAQSMIQHQKRYPNKRLIYQDHKLANIITNKEMPAKLNQLPKAIGPMHYRDIVTNLTNAIEKLEQLLDQFQPFLYVAKQQPNQSFNVDQFQPYLKIWNQMYHQYYQKHLDWISSQAKLNDVEDTIEKLSNELGESNINQAIKDQLIEQLEQSHYQLLYHNDQIDDDIMKQNYLEPLTNQDVYQTIAKLISQ